MKHKFRKVLSILLTVAMLLSALPMNAFAAGAPAPGPGSSDSDVPSENPNNMSVDEETSTLTLTVDDAGNMTPDFSILASAIPANVPVRVSIVSRAVYTTSVNQGSAETQQSDYEKMQAYKAPGVAVIGTLYMDAWVYEYKPESYTGSVTLTPSNMALIEGGVINGSAYENWSEIKGITKNKEESGTTFDYTITKTGHDGTHEGCDCPEQSGLADQLAAHSYVAIITAETGGSDSSGQFEKVLDVKVDASSGTPRLVGVSDIATSDYVVDGYYTTIYDDESGDASGYAKIKFTNVGSATAKITEVKFVTDAGTLVGGDGHSYDESGESGYPHSEQVKQTDAGNDSDGAWEVITRGQTIAVGEDNAVICRVDYTLLTQLYDSADDTGNSIPAGNVWMEVSYTAEGGEDTDTARVQIPFYTGLEYYSPSAYEFTVAAGNPNNTDQLTITDRSNTGFSVSANSITVSDSTAETVGKDTSFTYDPAGDGASTNFTLTDTISAVTGTSGTGITVGAAGVGSLTIVPETYTDDNDNSFGLIKFTYDASRNQAGDVITGKFNVSGASIHEGASPHEVTVTIHVVNSAELKAVDGAIALDKNTDAGAGNGDTVTLYAEGSGNVTITNVQLITTANTPTDTDLKNLVTHTNTPITLSSITNTNTSNDVVVPRQPVLEAVADYATAVGPETGTLTYYFDGITEPDGNTLASFAVEKVRITYFDDSGTSKFLDIPVTIGSLTGTEPTIRVGKGGTFTTSSSDLNTGDDFTLTNGGMAGIVITGATITVNGVTTNVTSGQRFIAYLDGTTSGDNYIELSGFDSFIGGASISSGDTPLSLTAKAGSDTAAGDTATFTLTLTDANRVTYYFPITVEVTAPDEFFDATVHTHLDGSDNPAAVSGAVIGWSTSSGDSNPATITGSGGVYTVADRTGTTYIYAKDVAGTWVQVGSVTNDTALRLDYYTLTANITNGTVGIGAAGSSTTDSKIYGPADFGSNNSISVNVVANADANFKLGNATVSPGSTISPTSGATTYTYAITMTKAQTTVSIVTEPTTPTTVVINVNKDNASWTGTDDGFAPPSRIALASSAPSGATDGVGVSSGKATFPDDTVTADSYSIWAYHGSTWKDTGKDITVTANTSNSETVDYYSIVATVDSAAAGSSVALTAGNDEVATTASSALYFGPATAGTRSITLTLEQDYAYVSETLTSTNTSVTGSYDSDTDIYTLTIPAGNVNDIAVAFTTEQVADDATIKLTYDGGTDWNSAFNKPTVTLTPVAPLIGSAETVTFATNSLSADVEDLAFGSYTVTVGSVEVGTFAFSASDKEHTVNVYSVTKAGTNGDITFGTVTGHISTATDSSGYLFATVDSSVTGATEPSVQFTPSASADYILDGDGYTITGISVTPTGSPLSFPIGTAQEDNIVITVNTVPVGSATITVTYNGGAWSSPVFTTAPSITVTNSSGSVISTLSGLTDTLSDLLYDTYTVKADGESIGTFTINSATQQTFSANFFEVTLAEGAYVGTFGSSVTANGFANSGRTALFLTKESGDYTMSIPASPDANCEYDKTTLDSGSLTSHSFSTGTVTIAIPASRTVNATATVDFKGKTQNLTFTVKVNGRAITNTDLYATNPVTMQKNTDAASQVTLSGGSHTVTGADMAATYTFTVTTADGNTHTATMRGTPATLELYTVSVGAAEPNGSSTGSASMDYSKEGDSFSKGGASVLYFMSTENPTITLNEPGSENPGYEFDKWQQEVAGGTAADASVTGASSNLYAVNPNDVTAAIATTNNDNTGIVLIPTYSLIEYTVTATAYLDVNASSMGADPTEYTGSVSFYLGASAPAATVDGAAATDGVATLTANYGTYNLYVKASGVVGATDWTLAQSGISVTNNSATGSAFFYTVNAGTATEGTAKVNGTSSAVVLAGKEVGISASATNPTTHYHSGWDISGGATTGAPSSGDATYTVPATGVTGAITLTPTFGVNTGNIMLTVKVDGAVPANDDITSVYYGTDSSYTAGNLTSYTDITSSGSGGVYTASPMVGTYYFYVTTDDGIIHTVTAGPNATLNLYTVSVAPNDTLTASAYNPLPYITESGGTDLSSENPKVTKTYVQNNGEVKVNAGTLTNAGGYDHTGWSGGNVSSGVYTSDGTGPVTLKPTYTWKHTATASHTDGATGTVVLKSGSDEKTGTSGVFSGLALDKTYTIWVNGFNTGITVAHNTVEDTVDDSATTGYHTTKGAGGETTVVLRKITTAVAFRGSDGAISGWSDPDGTDISDLPAVDKTYVPATSDGTGTVTATKPAWATGRYVETGKLGTWNDNSTGNTYAYTVPPTLSADVTITYTVYPHLKLTLGDAQAGGSNGAPADYTATVDGSTGQAKGTEKWVQVASTGSASANLGAAVASGFFHNGAWQDITVTATDIGTPASFSFDTDTTVGPVFLKLPTLAGVDTDYDIGLPTSNTNELPKYTWVHNDASTITSVTADSEAVTGYSDADHTLTLTTATLETLGEGSNYVVTYTYKMPGDDTEYTKTANLTVTATKHELTKVDIKITGTPAVSTITDHVSVGDDVGYEAHEDPAILTSELTWTWYYAASKPAEGYTSTTPLDGWTAIENGSGPHSSHSSIEVPTDAAGKYVFAVVTASGDTVAENGGGPVVTNAIPVLYDATISIVEDTTPVTSNSYTGELKLKAANGDEIAVEWVDDGEYSDDDIGTYVAKNLKPGVEYTIYAPTYENAGDSVATTVKVKDNKTPAAVNYYGVTVTQITAENAGTKVTHATFGTPGALAEDFGSGYPTITATASVTTAEDTTSEDVIGKKVLSGTKVDLALTGAYEQDYNSTLTATVGTGGSATTTKETGTNGAAANLPKIDDLEVKAPTTVTAALAQNTYEVIVGVRGEGSLASITLTAVTDGEPDPSVTDDTGYDAGETATFTVPKGDYTVSEEVAPDTGTQVKGYKQPDSDTYTSATQGESGHENLTVPAKTSVAIIVAQPRLSLSVTDKIDKPTDQSKLNSAVGTQNNGTAAKPADEPVENGTYTHTITVPYGAFPDAIEVPVTLAAGTSGKLYNVTRTAGESNSDKITIDGTDPFDSATPDLAASGTETFTLSFEMHNTTGGYTGVGTYTATYTFKFADTEGGTPGETPTLTYTLTVNVVPAEVTELFIDGLVPPKTNEAPVDEDDTLLYPNLTDKNNSENSGNVTTNAVDATTPTNSLITDATIQSVTWNPADNPFAPGTGYTATITVKLTDTNNFDFTNTTLVNKPTGATSVSAALGNDSDTLVITVVYPPTLTDGIVVKADTYDPVGANPPTGQKGQVTEISATSATALDFYYIVTATQASDTTTNASTVVTGNGGTFNGANIIFVSGKREGTVVAGTPSKAVYTGIADDVINTLDGTNPLKPGTTYYVYAVALPAGTVIDGDGDGDGSGDGTWSDKLSEVAHATFQTWYEVKIEAITDGSGYTDPNSGTKHYVEPEKSLALEATAIGNNTFIKWEAAATYDGDNTSPAGLFKVTNASDGDDGASNAEAFFFPNTNATVKATFGGVSKLEFAQPSGTIATLSKNYSLNALIHTNALKNVGNAATTGDITLSVEILDASGNAISPSVSDRLVASFTTANFTGPITQGDSADVDLKTADSTVARLTDGIYTVKIIATETDNGEEKDRAEAVLKMEVSDSEVALVPQIAEWDLNGDLLNSSKNDWGINIGHGGAVADWTENVPQIKYFGNTTDTGTAPNTSAKAEEAYEATGTDALTLVGWTESESSGSNNYKYEHTDSSDTLTLYYDTIKNYISALNPAPEAGDSLWFVVKINAANPDTDDFYDYLKIEIVDTTPIVYDVELDETSNVGTGILTASVHTYVIDKDGNDEPDTGSEATIPAAALAVSENKAQVYVDWYVGEDTDGNNTIDATEWVHVQGYKHPLESSGATAAASVIESNSLSYNVTADDLGKTIKVVLTGDGTNYKNVDFTGKVSDTGYTYPVSDEATTKLLVTVEQVGGSLASPLGTKEYASGATIALAVSPVSTNVFRGWTTSVAGDTGTTVVFDDSNEPAGNYVVSASATLTAHFGTKPEAEVNTNAGDLTDEGAYNIGSDDPSGDLEIKYTPGGYIIPGDLPTDKDTGKPTVVTVGGEVFTVDADNNLLDDNNDVVGSVSGPTDGDYTVTIKGDTLKELVVNPGTITITIGGKMPETDETEIAPEDWTINIEDSVTVTVVKEQLKLVTLNIVKTQDVNDAYTEAEKVPGITLYTYLTDNSGESGAEALVTGATAITRGVTYKWTKNTTSGNGLDTDPPYTYDNTAGSETVTYYVTVESNGTYYEQGTLEARITLTPGKLTVTVIGEVEDNYGNVMGTASVPNETANGDGNYVVEVPSGELVTVNAEPNDGYVFVRWDRSPTDGGTFKNNNVKDDEFAPVKNTTLTPVFKAATIDPTHGSASIVYNTDTFTNIVQPVVTSDASSDTFTITLVGVKDFKGDTVTAPSWLTVTPNTDGTFTITVDSNATTNVESSDPDSYMSVSNELTYTYDVTSEGGDTNTVTFTVDVVPDQLVITGEPTYAGGTEQQVHGTSFDKNKLNTGELEVTAEKHTPGTKIAPIEWSMDLPTFTYGATHNVIATYAPVNPAEKWNYLPAKEELTVDVRQPSHAISLHDDVAPEESHTQTKKAGEEVENGTVKLSNIGEDPLYGVKVEITGTTGNATGKFGLSGWTNGTTMLSDSDNNVITISPTSQNWAAGTYTITITATGYKSANNADWTPANAVTDVYTYTVEIEPLEKFDIVTTIDEAPSKKNVTLDVPKVPAIYTQYDITGWTWYENGAPVASWTAGGNLPTMPTTSAEKTYKLRVEVTLKPDYTTDNIDKGYIGDPSDHELTERTTETGAQGITRTTPVILWYTWTVPADTVEPEPPFTPTPPTPPTPSAGNTVTYVPGDLGESEDPLTESVSDGGKPQNVPEVTPKDDGDQFVGWTTVDPETIPEGEDITFVEPTETTITKDTTFYAVILPRDIRVNYELGSFGETTDPTEEIVAKYAYPSFTPEVTVTEAAKELATFVGWSLEKPDHVLEVELVDPLTVRILKDTTFYAVYEITEYEYHEHYMIGYPDGNFEPAKSITRAEVATIIARAVLPDFIEGSWYGDGGFSDVEGHWALSAIGFVTSHGIFNGYGDGTFRPNRPITREEYATVIARLKGLLDGTREDLALFLDYEDVSDWAIDGVYTCAVEGWIEGYEDDTFLPGKDINRAEAAKMMNGYLNRGVDEPGVSTIPQYIQFPDVYWGHWAYWHIAEAVNDHYYYYYNVDADGNDIPPEKWVIEAGYLNVKLDDSDPDNTKNVRRYDPIYVNSVNP